MTQIIKLHSRMSDEYCAYFLGQVPGWLNVLDPRSAREQINEGYRFGGWQPIKGAKLGSGNAMCYPGDPPMLPFAEIAFRNERIWAYPSEFWGIKEADGTVTFARMD